MATQAMAKVDLNLVPFSLKQKKLFTWWTDNSPYKDKDVIIFEGSIRAGKTIVGSMSFITWLMQSFDRQNFGIAGKSLDALKRNLWVPIQPWLSDVGISVVRLRDTANGYILKQQFIIDNKLIYKENYIYLFGGKDEGSAAFVQGLTAAGFFFDEVALMPQSFVNQAVARCSVEGSKIWFNCNPEDPYHWFKTEWVDKLHTRNGYRMHFTMKDNPSLSEKTLKRYNNTYEGVFHQRFILGLWVAAEGIIYNSFANAPNNYIVPNTDKWLLDNNLRIAAAFIGVDWGHNKSANTAVAIGITYGYEYVVVLDEWYSTDPFDPEALYKRHTAFITKIVNKYKRVTVFPDNAEMMMVRGLATSIAKHQLAASVKPCIKYEIVDRIVLTTSLFAQGRLVVGNNCPHLIGAFKTALWDDKKKKDVRLDDGTSNIDSLDAFEYSMCSSMRQLMSASYSETG